MAAWLYPVLLAASTAMNMYGKYKEQQNIETTSKYNQQLIEANSTIQQLGYQFDIDRLEREKEVFVGQQRAAISKSGVKFEGTAISLLKNSIKEYEISKTAIEFNRMAAAFSASQQANAYGYQAEQAGKRKYIEPFTTLLNAGVSYGLTKYGGQM